MNKEQELYKKALENLAEENQNNSKKLMNDVYKEKKKQRDRFLKFAIGLYAIYKLNDEGGLVLKQAEKKKIKMQARNLLTNMAVKLATNEEKYITKALEEAAINTYGKTNYLIDIGLDFDLKIGGLSKEEISKIINKQLNRKSFSTRIWDNQQALINQLNREINDIISKGKDVRKASKAIKERFNVNAYNAKRIVQNETKNVQTRIQDKIYRENELIKKVMWVSTLDEKTREEHIDLDGQMWDANENHRTPEDFVNCRCSLVPVIDGWNPTKRRDNSSKEIIEYKNYKEWAKNKRIS